MCGFAGILTNPNFPNRSSLGKVASKMAAAIAHRGPDDSGVWWQANEVIALAHQRLSILDLSRAGHQPMISHSGRHVIVFNGEIYNHLELRRELNSQRNGTQWIGSSDTETLITAIETWGIEETLERTVGMFSIAIWDRKEHVLQLARDRFGEKPLYYGFTGEGSQKTFLFASELAAIRSFPGFSNRINREALSQLLRFSAISAPCCIYQGMNQLLPGHLLTIRESDLEEPVTSQQWWCFRTSAETASRQRYYQHQGQSNIHFFNETEALNALEKTLQISIEKQSLADVSLGTFLSGGIDSSLITALLQKNNQQPIRSFTIGFEEEDFNEAPFARSVAKHLGTDHCETILTASEAMEIIPSLAKIYSEPFADSSQIPTHLVCREARKNGLKVVLSGDGGDELFGGYNRYFWGPKIWSRVNWMPFHLRYLLGCTIRNIPPSKWDRAVKALGIPQVGHKAHKLAERLQRVRTSDELYLSLISEWKQPLSIMQCEESSYPIFEPPSAVNLPLPSLISEDPAERMMAYDTLNYLPNDILTKLDRAAMAASLETRAPFLDHRVAEMAWQLPMTMKIRNKSAKQTQAIGKWALRQILYKYVPSELIDRPKAGFGIPIGQWLRGSLREWAEELLNPIVIENQGYLKSQPIQQLWEQHLTGRFDHTHKLWIILMWQAWLKEWG